MRLLRGCSSDDIEERKKFSEWVLGIGDGSVGEINDQDIKVQIPDHIASIVDYIYPSLLDNMHEPSFFQDRAILTPKNAIVEEINEYVMSLIPGYRTTYLSCDSPLSSNSMEMQLLRK